MYNFTKIYLLLDLASNFNISRYNHIKVTNNQKLVYHSIYFGAFIFTQISTLSKSNIKFKDAIQTTNKLNNIQTVQLS